MKTLNYFTDLFFFFEKMPLKPGLAQLQIHFLTILGRIQHHQALRDTLIIVSHREVTRPRDYD